ncbi:hypothetical protein pb186bvf_003070 [Paramecium bursaria]
MRQQVGSITAELSNTLKLKDLVKQFELVRSMDSFQGTNELTQLEDEQQHDTYVASKEKVKDNQQLIINNFQNNQLLYLNLSFKIISNEIEQIGKTSLELLNKIVTYGIPMNIFDEIYQYPQTHYQISEGKQIQYQLLYQGTRDGLHGQYYWAKCNGQSNLLIIMTSKNGQKFGGYSPCSTNTQTNSYVSDATMKSFLFQQNKKEIYKIKSQDKAIYCISTQGPTFGGQDLSIGQDFNSGSLSALGTNYDISNYNIVDKANHIFGATDPQLQECKVYKK